MGMNCFMFVGDGQVRFFFICIGYKGDDGIVDVFVVSGIDS